MSGFPDPLLTKLDVVATAAFVDEEATLSPPLSYLMQDVPECRGVDDDCHRVFVTTNEDAQRSTLEKLSRHELNGDTMIGVSGFFTLNAASIRGLTSQHSQGGIKNLIMIDCSERVNDFWQSMETIIKTSTTRGEAIEKTERLLHAKRDLYYPTPEGCARLTPKCRARHYITDLRKEIESGESWLSSDDRFERIKAIFDAGKFCFKKVNLCDKASMDSIASKMAAKGMTLDTIYLSNTREYAEEDGELETYQQSLEALISRRAFIIDTRARGCYNCAALTQRVVRRNTSPLSECFLRSPPRECRARAPGPVGPFVIPVSDLAAVGRFLRYLEAQGKQAGPPY